MIKKLLAFTLFFANHLILAKNKTPGQFSQGCQEIGANFAANFKQIMEEYDARMVNRGYEHVDDKKLYEEKIKQLRTRIVALSSACPELNELWSHLDGIARR